MISQRMINYSSVLLIVVIILKPMWAMVLFYNEKIHEPPR